MIKKIFPLSIIFLSAVLQFSFFPNFFAQRNLPDSSMIFLAIVMVELGFSRVWKWIVLAGIIFDILSFSFIGSHVLTYVLIGFLFDFFVRRFVVGQKTWKYFMSSLMLIPGVWLGDVLPETISWFSFSLKNIQEKVVPFPVFHFSFLKIIFSVILFLIFYGIFVKIKKTFFFRGSEIRIK